MALAGMAFCLLYATRLVWIKNDFSRYASKEVRPLFTQPEETE